MRFAATVGSNGVVKNVQLVSGHPLLVPAANAAVQKYVYRPATQGGQPVESCEGQTRARQRLSMPLCFAPAVTKTGRSLLDVRTAKENAPSRTMHNLSTTMAVRLSHTIR